MVLILILGLLIGAICIFLVFFVLSFLSAGPLVVSPKKNINALFKSSDAHELWVHLEEVFTTHRVVRHASQKKA